MFTGCVGATKEIFALAIVNGTAVNQISHFMVSACQKRRIFKPMVLYTDTYPDNDSFWRAVFGVDLEMRLGLFHLLHRVVETLDRYCDLYWKCLVDLKKCTYVYNTEDWEGLVQALGEGKFNDTSTPVTSDEIESIQQSKRWKQRYDSYLRKIILGGATIKHNLSRWIVEWRDKTDLNGRSVFTASTKKATRNQFNKVKHVSDVPGLDMYRKIPAGPRSKHGLPKYLSDRPEAALEKFHEFLAHVANTGSNPDLADPLTLGGTCDFNTKCRWRAWLNDKKTKNEDPGIPGHFEGEPRFWDHSFLSHLNAEAEAGGLSRIFEDVFEIGPDNDEAFLSKYFVEQEERNQKFGQDPLTSMCLCDTCRDYVPNRPSVNSDLKNNNVRRESTTTQPRPNNGHDNTQVAPRICAPTMNNQPISTQLVPTVSQRFVDLRCVYVWSQSHAFCYGGYPFYCNAKEMCLRKISCGERILGRHKHDLACPRRQKLKNK